MLFDTDVLIWLMRGNLAAAKVAQESARRVLSVVVYMELLQGCRSKSDCQTIRSFLTNLAFEVVPLTENIGHRAAVYVEEHAASSGMRVADALVAATAVEHGVPLCTADQKHYRLVADLALRSFKP